MTRGAAAVGAGLAARARPADRAGERIHVVGVGGAGASAAALHAQAPAPSATGCDAGGPSPYTAPLDAVGIRLAWEHDSGPRDRRRPCPDRLAVTKALTAIEPDHPELRRRARAADPGRAVAAGRRGRRRRSALVAVAGTHGKSTSAGWLVHVLARPARIRRRSSARCSRRRSSAALPATARAGAGARTSSWRPTSTPATSTPYRPAVALVTNVEWDHPDVFEDREAVIAAVERWLRAPAEPSDARRQRRATRAWSNWSARSRAGAGALVAYALLEGAPRPAGGFARGLVEQFATPAARPSSGADPRRSEPGRPSSSSTASTTCAAPSPSGLPTAGPAQRRERDGRRGAALTLGVAPDAIATGLASFEGVGRRLERMGEAARRAVYDDYGHHPTAIRATLAAVRQREPGRRVWAVYEPLTYHRTAALLDAFADVLATADAVAIAEIWAGRDPDRTIASAAGLADAVARRNPGSRRPRRAPSRRRPLAGRRGASPATWCS